MREKYESLSLATLKDLAKARGLRGISTLRKPELIERMLQEDEKEQNTQNTAPQPEKKISVQNSRKIKSGKYANLQKHWSGPKIMSYGIMKEELIRNAHRRNLVSVIRKEIQKETRNVFPTGIMNRVRKEMTDIRIGLKRALRQIQHSWTAERRLTVFWKYCRMDMDLSAVRIIFREKMTFMFHLPRSADLI